VTSDWWRDVSGCIFSPWTFSGPCDYEVSVLMEGVGSRLGQSEQFVQCTFHPLKDGRGQPQRRVDQTMQGSLYGGSRQMANSQHELSSAVGRVLLKRPSMSSRWNRSSNSGRRWRRNPRRAERTASYSSRYHPRCTRSCNSSASSSGRSSRIDFIRDSLSCGRRKSAIPSKLRRHDGRRSSAAS
jgi:hypothetical protein